jgi:NAD-dependent dihydropyrimidine dehydrogenase PreA subunit
MTSQNGVQDTEDAMTPRPVGVDASRPTENTMNTGTYIITQPCIGVKDRGCVEVCPVDCIYEISDKPGHPDMLYIHPGECIE